jgi:tartrate dehydrogenase/decarboxylase/D-malate dehydrogenase
MKYYKIAVIPGDGIGKEVVPAGIKVLSKVQKCFNNFNLEFEYFDWGCEYYLKNGRMMPENSLDILKKYDAIYLGAIGYPGVPDHISLWGLLLPIRRTFRQYVNFRPVKLFEGIKSPLDGIKAGDIDIIIIRENNEGEYSNIGGRLYEKTDREVVIQESVFTRFGVERIIKYAFEYAMNNNRKRVTAATKSNGISYTMPFWDEIFFEVGENYPNIQKDKFHIDALVAKFVTDPKHFDVVVGSNLFGDILSDLGPAIAGSLGIAPSANINPLKEFPSMFEPVHGSAPDIAGKNIANPIGQIWSGALMLDNLGLVEAGKSIELAIEKTIKNGILTPDLGGKYKTNDVTGYICDVL